jgi:hypothetical protein
MKTKHHLCGPRPVDLLACTPLRRMAHAKPDKDSLNIPLFKRNNFFPPPDKYSY